MAEEADLTTRSKVSAVRKNSCPAPHLPLSMERVSKESYLRLVQGFKLSATDSQVWHQESLAVSTWKGLLGRAQSAAAVSHDSLLPNTWGGEG